MFSKHGAFMPEVTIKKNNIPTLEEMRNRMNLDEMKKALENRPPIVFNDIKQNNEETKHMKEALVRGKKNLLKGIYPNKNTTMYQEFFKGHDDKYRLENKPDFYTSGIKGKIPDPYIIKKMNSQREIHSALKANIKNILFKDFYK